MPVMFPVAMNSNDTHRDGRKREKFKLLSTERGKEDGGVILITPSGNQKYIYMVYSKSTENKAVFIKTEIKCFL